MNNLLIPTYDLPRAYRRGDIIGAIMDSEVQPPHLRRFARWMRDQAKAEMPHYLFATAPKSNWAAGLWRGKRAMLYKAWSALDREKALMGAQLTGDCTSWGERCKQDIRRSVEILVDGELEEYTARQATCAIYAGRGHTGQGASPIGVANYAMQCGILPEILFTDTNGKKWDFRNYQNYVNIGINYGRTGLPRSILDITSKNAVLGNSLVETIEELCDLLYNGYASSIGFSIDTAPEGDPVSRFNGTTAHETCIVGYDDTPEGRAACKRSLGYEDTVIMFDQSWGKWNRVTNVLPEWEPLGEGMYFHSARDAQRLLNEKECTTTTGSINGFKGTPLDNLLV